MISKNLMVGMKVVPIKKSIGQNFEDWKEEYFGDSKYVIVERFVSRDYRPYRNYWICNIPDTQFVGHFKASDLVEYQE